MTLIKVLHLSKIYRISDVATIALSDVSFTIDKNEFVAIMGPSGSGKSTLMDILGCLDLPTSGEYFLDGANITHLADDELADIRNKKIGFVFQAFNLLPRTTALQNVILPMRYAGIPQEERIKRATECLQIVGLGDRINHSSNQLSGGQQQRVAIARALSLNPSIILADEPTGNLATTQANEIMKTLDQLYHDGHTIVMITHEYAIARHAQRIMQMKDGKIIDDSASHKQNKIKNSRGFVKTFTVL